MLMLFFFFCCLVSQRFSTWLIPHCGDCDGCDGCDDEIYIDTTKNVGVVLSNNNEWSFSFLQQPITLSSSLLTLSINFLFGFPPQSNTTPLVTKYKHTFSLSQCSLVVCLFVCLLLSVPWCLKCFLEVCLFDFCFVLCLNHNNLLVFSFLRSELFLLL